MSTAVAVFKQDNIIGEALALTYRDGIRLTVSFDKLPTGLHGFHIHSAGDLRGDGCTGACSHWNIGSAKNHGAGPESKGERHTGDLGNIEGPGPIKYSYYLKKVKPSDLWGRTLIVHEDEDDLGLGEHEDSHTTGHSGKRIGCAIFGRGAKCGVQPHHIKKQHRYTYKNSKV